MEKHRVNDKHTTNVTHHGCYGYTQDTTGTMFPAVSPHDEAAAMASAKQVGCALLLLCITEHMRQNFGSKRTHSYWVRPRGEKHSIGKRGVYSKHHEA